MLLILGNDMIEIWDDCAENSEPPKVLFTRRWPRYPAHQQKPGDFRWRSPGADAAFGFIVEQVLTTKSRNAISLERGGEFAPAGIPELVSTQRACDAPSEQLASQD